MPMVDDVSLFYLLLKKKNAVNYLGQDTFLSLKIVLYLLIKYVHIY